MSKAKKDFVEENMVEEQETVEEEIVEETVEEEVEENETFGEVSNCERLNTRTSPSTKAAVRGVIDEGDVVKILEERTPEWYRIRTENYVEGFCMAEYITKLP